MERKIPFVVAIGAVLDFRIVGTELCRAGLAGDSDAIDATINLGPIGAVYRMPHAFLDEGKQAGVYR